MIEAAGKERLELELLSPVGDSERLDDAIAYGADAVYLAGREFGMRSAPANFTDEELDQMCIRDRWFCSHRSYRTGTGS